MKNPEDRLTRQFPLDILVASGFPLIWSVLGLMMLKAMPGGLLLGVAVASMAIAFAGGVLMTIAKWSLYRQGKFFSIGAAGLPESRIRLYAAGLRLAAAGLTVAAILVGVLWLPG